MGHQTFSTTSYNRARHDYGITNNTGVTRKAEEQARRSGRLSAIVDPAVEPIRRSMIRLNPYQHKQWITTIGCPMDIEVSCDTTGSMGGEVDTEMAVLPDLYGEVAKVLPGYDPQLCLGIFGDCEDPFVMCRPQFEMEAPKIVNYLKEMAPQRGGCGNGGEDPQYAMFARAYLTDAYTNRIGLKGYHFIVTDEPCHEQLKRSEVERIFGENIFKDELKHLDREFPTMENMVRELKRKTHQFILVLSDYTYSAVNRWESLCGEGCVIMIESTHQLPAVVSAIIGLTEGTLDIGNLGQHLGEHRSAKLIQQLSRIELGAQAKLRHQLPYPVPQKGDIFASKGDIWPLQEKNTSEFTENDDSIQYL